MVVWGLFYIIGALFLTRSIRMAERRLRLRLGGQEYPEFIFQLLRALVWLTAFVFFAHMVPELRALGTALLAAAGVTSVVVGLAAQSTLSNLIAGVSLVVYRPVRIGDRIQIAAPTGVETGDVESINLGYTIIRTLDHRRVVVPNSLIASQTTINLSSVNPVVMAVVRIGVGYDTDVERARAILIDIANSHDAVQRVVDCPVVELASSSVVLALRAMCKNPSASLALEYALYELAKARFAREGIEIPYAYANVIVKDLSRVGPTSDGHASPNIPAQGQGGGST